MVVPEAAPPPASVPTLTSTPSHATLSPAWFYVGLGASALFTGLTVWSGLDTKSAYSDYERDLPRLDLSEAEQRVSQGHSRELRTNLLLAGSLVCGAGTAALGIWFVDFSGQARAKVGLSPSAIAVSGTF